MRFHQLLALHYAWTAQITRSGSSRIRVGGLVYFDALDLRILQFSSSDTGILADLPRLRFTKLAPVLTSSTWSAPGIPIPEQLYQLRRHYKASEFSSIHLDKLNPQIVSTGQGPKPQGPITEGGVVSRLKARSAWRLGTSASSRYAPLLQCDKLLSAPLAPECPNNT